jgi:hypothetical protein
MEETSLSPAPSAFLTPFETLKERCLEEHNEYRVNEFRLVKQPGSLKDFVDLSSKENGEIDRNRILWVGDAFVNFGNGTERLPQAYQECRFRLTVKSDSRSLRLDIHSSTLEEAIACLDFLVGIEDTYYEEMELHSFGPSENGQPVLCPVSNDLLEKFILQNESRLNTFDFFTLTRAQCGILATSGTRTKIGLYECRFQDDGAAFVQSLQGITE